MDKVLAKNGARHNIETLFSDLQSFIQNSIIKTLNGAIQSYGIIAEVGADGNIVSADTALKVTYTTPGFVTVGAGKAITSPLYFFDIPGQNFALTSGLHTLYVKYKTQDSGLTAVLNGFKFTPGENLTATRQLDSYEFVWDTNPGINVSGLVLADVTSDGTVVSLITDRRSENLFELSYDGIPGEVKTKLHTQNSDTGTTAPNFYVNTGGVPRRVLTEYDLLGTTLPSSFTPLVIKGLMLDTGIDPLLNIEPTIKLDMGL